MRISGIPEARWYDWDRGSFGRAYSHLPRTRSPWQDTGTRHFSTHHIEPDEATEPGENEARVLMPGTSRTHRLQVRRVSRAAPHRTAWCHCVQETPTYAGYPLW